MSSLESRTRARVTDSASNPAAVHPATIAARRNALNGFVNAHGRRWGGDRNRGKLPIPKHADPLVRRLFEEMNRQRVNIAEVAERAGIKPATVSDWRYRRAPTAPLLQAAFNALGRKLVDVAE